MTPQPSGVPLRSRHVGWAVCPSAPHDGWRGPRTVSSHTRKVSGRPRTVMRISRAALSCSLQRGVWVGTALGRHAGVRDEAIDPEGQVGIVAISDLDAVQPGLSSVRIIDKNFKILTVEHRVPQSSMTGLFNQSCAEVKNTIGKLVVDEEDVVLGELEGSEG